MANAYRDENNVPCLIASSSSDGQTPIRLYANPSTHRLLVDATGANGTFVYNEVPTDSGNQLLFTLAHTPLSNTTRLYRGGARQKLVTDYTVSTNTITLGSALSGGELLIIDYNY